MNRRPMCLIPGPRCHHAPEDPVELHHLLGRREDGRYIWPELFIPLCSPDDHQGGVHRLLQVAEIDGPRSETPGLLIGRIATSLRWITWTVPPPARGAVLDNLPLLVRGCAEVLDRVGRDLRATEASQ